MNKRRFQIGPGAASLLLIFVVLSMSVLGILTLISARNDASLGVRSAAAAQEVYQLNSAAEASLARLHPLFLAAEDQEALEELLPEEYTMEEDIVSWTETCGSRSLVCAIQFQPDDPSAFPLWVRHTLQTALAQEDELEFD